MASVLLTSLGTAHRYNAPEVNSQEITQISPENLHKCDIWAFGLLVWEILKNGGHYFDQRWIVERSATGASNEVSVETAFDLSLIHEKALAFLREMRSSDSSNGDFVKGALRALLSNTLQMDPVARRSILKEFPIITAWK